MDYRVVETLRSLGLDEWETAEVLELLEGEDLYSAIRRVNPEAAERYRRTREITVVMEDLSSVPLSRDFLLSQIEELSVPEKVRRKVVEEVEEEIREKEENFLTRPVVTALMASRLFSYGFVRAAESLLDSIPVPDDLLPPLARGIIRIHPDSLAGEVAPVLEADSVYEVLSLELRGRPTLSYYGEDAEEVYRAIGDRVFFQSDAEGPWAVINGYGKYYVQEGWNIFYFMGFGKKGVRALYFLDMKALSDSYRTEEDRRRFYDMLSETLPEISREFFVVLERKLLTDIPWEEIQLIPGHVALDGDTRARIRAEEAVELLDYMDFVPLATREEREEYGFPAAQIVSR